MILALSGSIRKLLSLRLLASNGAFNCRWPEKTSTTNRGDSGNSILTATIDIYFPGKAEGLRAKLDRISSKADVATLQLESPPPPNSAVLELDDRTEATVTGDPVVLIGYPTGIEGILARAGADVTQKIAGGNQDVNRIMSRLASQRLIRPTTTQGHIGDVLEDKIVYDAATTSGGSGGPLFNREGKVITSALLALFLRCKSGNDG